MNRVALHRVYFDGNDRVDINKYGLWLQPSLADLQKIGAELQEGLRVIIYSPGELQGEAILEFNSEYDAWVAIGIDGTWIDLEPEISN